MTDRYILDDLGVAHPEPDLARWRETFWTTDRHVAQTPVGDIRVSTIFLGFDHSWDGRPPLLFETRILGGEHDQYQKLYSTRTEALLGHKRAVALASGQGDPDDA